MMQRAFGTGYLAAAGVLIMARLMDLCVVCAMFALGAPLARLLRPGAWYDRLVRQVVMVQPRRARAVRLDR
jgi:hypothetical protein